MKLTLLLLAAGSLWAGESINLTTGVVGNNNIPAQDPNAVCRVESSIHGWSTGANGHFADLGACGFILVFNWISSTDIRLGVQNYREADGPGCQFFLNQLPSTFLIYRFQHIPNGHGGGVGTCEIWDINGKRYIGAPQNNSQYSYTSTVGANYPGACVSGANAPSGCGIAGATNLQTAYFRAYTTSVPVNSTPPTTAQSLAGCLFAWNFDGDLTDACPPNSYPASVEVGAVAYSPTPGQGVFAYARSGNIPIQDQPWATWVSARVGYPNSLDCTNSYSQSDASPNVACSWSVTKGPMIPVLTGSTTQTPSYTPTLFGTYYFSLTVADSSGNTAAASLSVGAVAYDDNGVVIPQDPRATQILGPMIAFGQNPWGYADERAYRGVQLQNSYYQTYWGLPSPSWMTNGQGTVSYTFAGIGPAPGKPGTTIVASVAPGDQTIQIADAGAIPGLANLPDWVTLGSNISGPLELVRVCGASATSGPATLIVCYNGRGINSWNQGPGSQKYTPPSSWAAGTIVGEDRVSGTGTLFVSDPNTSMCPAGAPGPAGPIVYSAGTVTLAPSSTAVVGQGTAWTSALVNDTIRVQATHAGGTPFVLWCIIDAVGSGTGMTCDAPAPPDVDPAAFSYAVVGYHRLSLDFLTPDGTNTVEHAFQGTLGCESETAMFATPSHDVAAWYNNQYFDWATFTGVHYSYDDMYGISGAFGPNFYGSGLGSLVFYLRSGWDIADITHKMMDDTWIKSPEVGAGYLGGESLLYGGAVAGAIASLVLDPTTQVTWPDVRQYMVVGAQTGNYTCSEDDTRGTGYSGLHVALGAAFDPDPGYRAQWQAALKTIYGHEQRCKHQDNSWANAFTTSPGAAGIANSLTVTYGSAVATGANIPQSACYGIAAGTVTVTAGSGNFTGTGLVDGNAINIAGTARHGAVKLPIRVAFSQSGGTSGVLGGLWPGDSGTFGYMIENSDNNTTIQLSNSPYDPSVPGSDVQSTKQFACMWIDSGHIMLDRPWDGPSSSPTFSYLPSMYHGLQLIGYFQQPFMMGIKTTELRVAGLSDAVLGTNFTALSYAAARWIQTVGFDPNTLGMNYGRIFGGCEPALTTTPGTTFTFRQPGCNYGGQASNDDAARTLNAEANTAISQNFIGQGYSASARAWGDLAYGAVWGYCPYTAPGYYCDPNYVFAENSDVALSNYKWDGFFFGMGMSHQWPAVRKSSGKTYGTPPTCSAGATQPLRAGIPAVLNGLGSAPNDGGGLLTFQWQGSSQPGLRWSSHAVVNPIVYGLTQGTATFQLAVTDSVGQTSRCSATYGVVASSDVSFSGNSSPASGQVSGIPTASGYVSYKLSSVAHAASARVVTTAADGTTVTTACSASPCAVPIDRREGAQLVQLQYLSSAGKVLAASQRPIFLAR